MGRCKPLDSLNSFLSYALQLSGANPVSSFTLLLSFPEHLSNHRWGWQHHCFVVYGALIHIWRTEITTGCDMFCLLVWQEIFSFHIGNVNALVKQLSQRTLKMVSYRSGTDEKIEIKRFVEEL